MTVALLLCDVWDQHWCSAATRGTARIAKRAEPLVRRMRSDGAVVIHAPSTTMAFYSTHPARRYVIELPRTVPRARKDMREPPPLPVIGSGCPDPVPCREPPGPPWPWTRQHEAIGIDDGDAILDRGDELFAVISDRAIDHVVIVGVHTNRCILERPFGIKALVRADVSCSLVGDLTEALPPAQTAASVDYIARYWCRVLASSDVSMTMIGGQ
jgi:nicotinamidase-related amidase